MISFAMPAAFLLLPLPLLARLLPPRNATGQAMALPDSIAAAASTAAGPAQWRGMVIIALAWLCLCLALAQPERIEMVTDRSASGRDIMIALDMSGSMVTPDFTLDGETITRLAAVKKAADGFIRSRTGDRIGLVVFGDKAFAASPLTHDLPAVVRALEEAEIGLTGRSTAISEGLGLALKRILSEPAQSKVIVLLSDGRETSDKLDATQVAALAAENGVRVHTVALGPEDLETRPAARDAVDIAALREIAAASGGQIFRVKNMSDLEVMMAELDRLEPNPSDRPPVAVARPLWVWPAGFAMLLIVLFGLVRDP